MKNYVDTFVFPIRKEHVQAYTAVAQEVAGIWKEHGATEYFEFVGHDLELRGTRSFTDAVGLEEGEVVIMGWASFPSKEVRDQANKMVPRDPRMGKLVGPLMDPNNPIFDPGRMIFGGFKHLVG